MASLPGGERKKLRTGNQAGQRRRPQIGSERKLKQVFK